MGINSTSIRWVPRTELSYQAWQQAFQNHWAILPAYFLFFMKSGTTADGMMPLKFRVGLGTSINPICKIPYIHAQRFASMVIINSMRLTIEINYHSGFRGQALAQCLFVVLIRDFNFFDLWQNHETGSRQFWPLLLLVGVKKYDLLCKIGSGQWDWGRDKCFSQCSVCRDPCQMLPQATIHSCSNLKPQTFKDTF